MYPIAAGHPQYSGTFIPELWSGKLVEKFYDATVLAAISNTDYEGEIKSYGDKVIIRTRPDVVIRDYFKGMNLKVDRPEAPTIELLIDKGKYYQQVMDDVDKVQQDIDQMDLWATESSEEMKIVIDRDVLGDIYAEAHSANTGVNAGRVSGSYNMGATGSPVAVTKADVLDYIVDMGSVLDEQNVPETGRFLVVPTWFSGLLKKSDLRDASITGDGQSVLRNGRLGMIDRFELFNSNLLPSVVDGANLSYHMLAGHKSGLTFATQMTNTESLRAESTFGTLVRGLQVYGYKVIKPESLVDFYAYKA